MQTMDDDKISAYLAKNKGTIITLNPHNTQYRSGDDSVTLSRGYITMEYIDNRIDAITGINKTRKDFKNNKDNKLAKEEMLLLRNSNFKYVLLKTNNKVSLFVTPKTFY